MFLALVLALGIALLVGQWIASETSKARREIERNRILVRPDPNPTSAVVSVLPVTRERPAPKDRPPVPTSPKEGTRVRR